MSGRRLNTVKEGRRKKKKNRESKMPFSGPKYQFAGVEPAYLGRERGEGKKAGRTKGEDEKSLTARVAHLPTSRVQGRLRSREKRAAQGECDGRNGARADLKKLYRQAPPAVDGDEGLREKRT